MNKCYFLLLIVFHGLSTNAQVFEVEPILNNGDPEKLINLVIMGDGYTETEQPTFIAKAGELTTYLFNQTPWSAYKNYFNVYAIKVISAESGAKHANLYEDCETANPLVPVSNPHNYLGSRFDNYNIHRLIIATNTGHIASVLAANFPNYDLITVIANTPHYGGSGGQYGTITAHGSANEIMAHEVGHTFANLADEYYAGDVYFGERPNMTAQSNPNLIKWKNWVNSDEVNIGIFNYCCGGNSSLWYRPTVNSCKMEGLGMSYCAVCREAIIEEIHAMVNPIGGYSPTGATISSSTPLLDFALTELVKPIPNTLEIKWQLDSAIFDTNLETFQVDQNNLAVGLHTLSASVTDATEYVRTDNHSAIHVSTVTWTIDRGSLGVNLTASVNKIAYAIYPNPTAASVNISIELDKESSLSIDLLTMDGKIIQHIPQKNAAKGTYEHVLDTENLAVGTYLVSLKIDGVSYTKTVIKQ